jgi:hypothetical protein
MSIVRTESNDKTRDYSGAKAHTLRNGYTLRNAATHGKQAAVVNIAIINNAQLGVTFTAEDAFRWQTDEAGNGRSSIRTLTDHLESLVGKGFLVGIEDSGYQLVRGATGLPNN